MRLGNDQYQRCETYQIARQQPPDHRFVLHAPAAKSSAKVNV